MRQKKRSKSKTCRKSGLIATENAIKVKNLSQKWPDCDRKCDQSQDFHDAINTVESYNSAETLEEASELLARVNALGLFHLNREGDCPCGFTFPGEAVEWIPNAVLSLKEFRMEKDKLLLTYHTVDDIERDYQFVLSKGLGRNDNGEGWHIEDINLKVKE